MNGFSIASAMVSSRIGDVVDHGLDSVIAVVDFQCAALRVENDAFDHQFDDAAFFRLRDGLPNPGEILAEPLEWQRLESVLLQVGKLAPQQFHFGFEPGGFVLNVGEFGDGEF